MSRRRRPGSLTGQHGRPSTLTAVQAARLREWAAIGINIRQAAESIGVSYTAACACIAGRHKKPYREE